MPRPRRVQTIEEVYSSRPDLKDVPLENPDWELYTDRSVFMRNGPYLNMGPITKATVAVIQFALWVNKAHVSAVVKEFKEEFKEEMKRMREEMRKISAAPVRVTAPKVRVQHPPARERGYTPQADLWFFLHDHGKDMGKWDGKPTSALAARYQSVAYECERQKLEATCEKRDSLSW
ncbi:hypothetical protein TURU_171239 [Turdus rufiventris]|nr:hypothetical protein TURU_171239 [Turdus rufiventris]